MFKKLISLTVVALLAMVINSSVFADKTTTHQCYCKPLETAVEKLNLTSEQQIKIKAIKKQMRESMRSKLVELRSLKPQLNGLIKSEKLDPAKLETLINQKKELLASIMKSRIMARNQIYNLLDTKQKEQFAQILDKRVKSHHTAAPAKSN
jgi:protein CpxP